MKNNDLNFIKDYYSKIKWMKLTIKNKNKCKFNTNPIIKPNQSSQISFHKYNHQKEKIITRNHYKSYQIIKCLDITKVKFNQMYSIKCHQGNSSSILKIQPVKRYQPLLQQNKAFYLRRRNRCKTSHSIQKNQKETKLNKKTSQTLYNKKSIFTSRLESTKNYKKQSLSQPSQKFTGWEVHQMVDDDDQKLY